MDDNSFFSIDRLVEFGMSAAIAQQMVNSMNVAMAGMNISGSMPKDQPAPPVYYVALEGKPVGPLNESELSQTHLPKEGEQGHLGVDAQHDRLAGYRKSACNIKNSGTDTTGITKVKQL